MHFLLWTKGSHEYNNFNTFKCSDENLPNSSCHFPNHKSVFLQILHDSSVSWNITHLYFFRWNFVYCILCIKRTNQSANFLDFLVLGSKFTKFLSFLKQKNCFQILHHSSVLWDITPLYFFGWNCTYFQQKEPIKVQIWWNFAWAVKSLKFCTLMGTHYKYHIDFLLKKYRRLISHDTEEWCKV